MKTFIFAAILMMAACHHKEAPKKSPSPCVTCAHSTCALELSVCTITEGCQEETSCLLECKSKDDDLAFKMCALDCLHGASEKSTEASRDFLMCFELKCEPTCHGESI
jgi:hypothetical protein